jgi:hypothetical protein
VLTQKGTTLKAIVFNLLNLSNRNSYRHSLVFFFVRPCMWVVTVELASCHPSGGWNFEVVPRFLKTPSSDIL